MKTQKERMTELVKQFRFAIEKAKQSGERQEFFVKFPRGQCGNASDMLAQFLIDNGIDEIYYEFGVYCCKGPYNSQSHAWLKMDDLLIDITADQFKDFPPPLTNDTPIYIGPHIPYYDSFNTDKSTIHKHYGLDISWNNYSELVNNYKTILKYME
jgi:hypothetical protein